MKKVLLITFHFPPDIHPGAKRLGKFAKYLPLYGWQPIVLTKQLKHYTGIDHTLSRNLPPEAMVYRVDEWHLFRNRRKDPRPAKFFGNAGNKQSGNTLRKLLYRLSNTFDYPWLLPAIQQGLRLIRQEHINILLTSYPTQEALIVGLLLKLITGKKWVVDYRDLTRSFPLQAWFLKDGNALRLAVNKTLDKIIVSKADVITVVGKRMRQDVIDVFGSKIIGKVHVVYNGYDRDDFSSTEKRTEREHPKVDDGTFVIIYLGSWTTLDTPEYFLKALGRLMRKGKGLRGKIRFIHIGEVRYDSELKQQIPRWIQEEELNDVVDDMPHLPHSEALSWLQVSSAALLIQNEIKECPGATDHCLPTKGFEYLAARKPILALAPLKGEIAEVIRSCNAGIVVPPTDVDAIEKAIYSIYNNFKNRTLNREMNVSAIERFDRRRQTEVLASIFNTLLMK